MYSVQGQHELVEMEMYLVHGVGQNVDLQEYAPGICSSISSRCCFPQNSKLFTPSTVMPPP